MIFEIIRGGGKLTGWGKNGPAYFFPRERMGRPILSSGKKMTGGKFWPFTGMANKAQVANTGKYNFFAAKYWQIFYKNVA